MGNEPLFNIARAQLNKQDKGNRYKRTGIIS